MNLAVIVKALAVILRSVLIPVAHKHSTHLIVELTISARIQF